MKLGLGGHVLGVAIGATDLTGVVVRRRDGREILGAALQPAPGAGAALGPLARGLGLGGGPVHLVVRGSGLHRILLVPPMSADDRQAFVGRELRREPSESQWAFAQTLVGRAEEADGPRDEVLVVGAPRQEIERQLAVSAAAGVRVDAITTAPLALLRAGLALAPPIPAQRDQPVAVALWDGPGLTIAVGAGATLAVARELPHVGTGVDPVERFASEIQRSLLFYRQQSHGLTATRVLVAAATPDLATRFDELPGRLGLPVVDLNRRLADVLPAGPADVEVGSPAEFLLAYGAALTPSGDALDLLPEPIVLRRRARALLTVAAALGALVATAVGGSYALHVGEARALDGALEALTAERERLLAARGAAGEAGLERRRYRDRLRLLRGAPPGLPVLSAALVEVARLAPGPLRFEKLTVAGGVVPPRLVIAGVAEAGDLVEAQAAVSAFHFALRESPLVADVRYATPPADGAGETPAAPGAGQRLPFEISLRVRTLE